MMQNSEAERKLPELNQMPRIDSKRKMKLSPQLKK